MDKVTSLENINASALPAKMLILLSKYAKTLRNTNGTIIKLSSLRIFMHVHKTCEAANSKQLNYYYDEMLEEINKHIQAGTMFTNEQREQSADSKLKKEPLVLAANNREKASLFQASK